MNKDDLETVTIPKLTIEEILVKIEPLLKEQQELPESIRPKGLSIAGQRAGYIKAYEDLRLIKE